MTTEVDEDAETKALRTLDADAGEAPEGTETPDPLTRAVKLLREAATMLRQADNIILAEVEDADLDAGHHPLYEEINAFLNEVDVGARRAGR